MKEQEKVLFVVYREEWWGCLDRLCREECEKENTLCYVMPVPRYEKEPGNPEANPEKVHVADSEKVRKMLPPGAVLSDYRNFSLEQEFDRIYIHNPYDNGSRVDSVDPKFYSENLQKYARKLIYVPHLLYLGGIPEEYRDCKAYEHVDSIYLPDRRARYSLDVNYDEKVQEVPSGIPEYLDRLAEESNDCRSGNGASMLPDGQQPKKKLLYCLSFRDLYQGNERQIQKMWVIFDYFRHNRNVQLIFRPDEEIKMKYHQLQPNVWEGYKKLLAYFKKHKIGVHDECVDLYRAAVNVDGVMSTGHPMDTLCSVQGKYVLHVDMEQRLMPSEEDRCVPILWAVDVIEGEEGLEIWFVPQGTKLICRMTIREKSASSQAMQAGIENSREEVRGNSKARGKKNKKASAAGAEGNRVEIIAEVPDDMVGGLNYISLLKRGNGIYLVPYASEGIWKYDLETGSFQEQYLPDAVNACMTATFSYGKYLYMVPRNYPGIVRYDTEMEEFQIIDGWVEELNGYVSEECRKEPYFIWAVKQEGSMLYMASSKCDVWMEFDMEKDSWRIVPLNLPGRRFINFVKDGERVWLFPFCGTEVVLWNRESGESHIIYRTVNREMRNSPYVGGMDLGDEIVAFPQQWTDHFLVIPKALSLEDSAVSEGADDVSMHSGISMHGSTAGILEQRGPLPCGEKAYLSEYLRQRKGGYQFMKHLASGRILAYEYYDGAFLVLDEKLRLLRKIPCRLPIEAVRQQLDLSWKNGQRQGDFHGGLGEGASLSVMVEYFVRHGHEDREKIRGHYKRELESNRTRARRAE